MNLLVSVPCTEAHLKAALYYAKSKQNLSLKIERYLSIMRKVDMMTMKYNLLFMKVEKMAVSMVESIYFKGAVMVSLRTHTYEWTV